MSNYEMENVRVYVEYNVHVNEDAIRQERAIVTMPKAFYDALVGDDDKEAVMATRLLINKVQELAVGKYITLTHFELYGETRNHKEVI